MNFLYYLLLGEEDQLYKEANWNVAKNLVSKSLSTVGNLAKKEFDSMGTFGKTMTALPVATTLPGMVNKFDDQGRSRAERLTGLGGNIAGGLAGSRLGTMASNKLNTSLGGSKLGKGIAGVGGLAAQMAGGIGGTIIGEQGASAPFKMLRKSNTTPTYNTGPQQSNPQQQFPLQSLPGTPK